MSECLNKKWNAKTKAVKHISDENVSTWGFTEITYICESNFVFTSTPGALHFATQQGVATQMHL